MFGNKKTSASSDNDIQLTTRSMKSDLEGDSSKKFVEKERKPLSKAPERKKELEIHKKPEIKKVPEPIATPAKSFDLPTKKPLRSTTQPQIKESGEFKLPTDFPAANKMPAKTTVDKSLEKQFGDKKEKTHANDFSPENKSKEEFPKNPIINPKKEPVQSAKLKPINPALKKDYDKFFKDKISPLPEKENKNSSSSMILVIILVIVLIIAIASGTYYYFFVINKPVTPTELPIISDPTPIFPVDSTPVQPPKEPLPIVLTEASEMIITAEKDTRVIFFDPQNSENLISGFYSIENEEGLLMNVKDLSTLLNIQMPESIETASQNAWIYYDATITPKISLVIKIDSKDTYEVKNSIMNIENNLPIMFSGLYSAPIDKYSTGETVIFKDSFENLNFRYYNISTTPSDLKSLDWGIINNDTILVFATSKEMASTISNQLLINDIPNNTTKEVILENTPEDVTPGDILENEAVVD